MEIGQVQVGGGEVRLAEDAGLETRLRLLAPPQPRQGHAPAQLSREVAGAGRQELPEQRQGLFGAAQALFFALFTGINGVLSMYDERKNGTLQRILVSPTPRWVVLGGKLVGTFVSVLAQLVILMLALTAVGSLLEGRPSFIWGNDVGMLVLVLMAVSLAVSGLGVFLAGLLKDMEQAVTIRQVLTMALGVLGGTFGFQLPRSVAQFSLVYWGRDAFDLLAAGHAEIWLNLLVLSVEGAVLFGIGLFFFNRKFEV